METIKVRLKNNRYNIYTGAGILPKTGTLLKKTVPGKKVLIVSNKKVYSLYGAKLTASLKKHFKVEKYLMPDGEQFKTMATVTGILEACAKAGLDRRCAIVALGGGVVGDTAAFAAAVYMRGIRVAQVATTLVAQVDSAIGGKTGVDLKAGKNLAGAFHQPVFVLSDTDTLKTLTEREFKNGLAEVIKYGIIMDAPFFKYLQKNRSAILNIDKKALAYIVKKCSQCKAGIVEKDEKETKGLRAILNYGHTLGHAIEAAAGYKTYKHGEAVAIGMALAAGMAHRVKHCSAETYNAQIQALKSFNLIKPLKKVKISSVLQRLYSDKKAKDGKIIFVLTKKIGYVTLVESINTNIIKEELERFLRSN